MKPSLEVTVKRVGWGAVAGWMIHDPETKLTLCDRDHHTILFEEEALADAFLRGYQFGYTVGYNDKEVEG